MRKILKSKIHRAVITDANVDYEGSITLPPHLMEEADIIEFESVHVWDVTNGSRFETYAIRAEEGSSDVIVNGAAAHLVSVKDIIIIASFTWLSDEALIDFKPILSFVDSQNQLRTR